MRRLISGLRPAKRRGDAAVCAGRRRRSRKELRRAFTPRTKAIILNSPNNPTGKVFNQNLSAEYARRRDHIVASLESAGFCCFVPQGAYYVMTDIGGLGFADDVAFVRHLIETVGVAALPGSSFYASPGGGSQQVRFCFCKKYETLEKARNQLQRLT
jgi:aspartate/methionine/tyrosine aminotransferase